MYNNNDMSAAAIDIQRRGSARIVSVSGDLDLASASDLRTVGHTQIADAQCLTLEIDLGKVAFIDSSGLGCLVELRNAAIEIGKSLTLVDIPSSVRRIIELGGLGPTLLPT